MHLLIICLHVIISTKVSIVFLRVTELTLTGMCGIDQCEPTNHKNIKRVYICWDLLFDTIEYISYLILMIVLVIVNNLLISVYIECSCVQWTLQIRQIDILPWSAQLTSQTIYLLGLNSSSAFLIIYFHMYQMFIENSTLYTNLAWGRSYAKNTYVTSNSCSHSKAHLEVIAASEKDKTACNIHIYIYI